MGTKKIERFGPFIFLGLGFVLLIFWAYLLTATWRGNSETHTVMEVGATFTSFTVAIMALLRFYTKKQVTILLIGVGFLGTGFLDLYHAIVTGAIFKEFFPSPPRTLIPWSWNVSRSFLSALMLWSWFVAYKETWNEEKISVKSSRIIISVLLLTLTTLLFFMFVPLPRAYYPEFIFGRPHEHFPAFFFLLALVGYLKLGLWRTDRFHFWIVISLILNFMTQALYMPFSYILFDPMFDVAHLLKIAAYLSILAGLLMDTYAVFMDSERDKAVIREINGKLNEKIDELEMTQQLLSHQRDLLTRSNQELEQFAYVASHDLQEPLRKVISYAELFENKVKGTLDDSAKKYLHYMVDGARRMQGLIRDLLTYSRLSQGELKKEEVDVGKVFQQVMSDLEIRISELGANITAVPLPNILANKRQLGQLLQNLISNAMKYSRKDVAPEIRVCVEKKDPYWEFSISDNGIGIDPQYEERIFVIFQRLHTRQEYSGTGIGLAVCKKIVERHGGKIWIKSDGKSGTTFFFTLPC